MTENKKMNLTITLDEDIKGKITEIARERQVRVSTIFEEYAKAEIAQYEAEKAEKNAVQTARQEGEKIARFYFENGQREELKNIINKMVSSLSGRNENSINSVVELMLTIAAKAEMPCQTAMTLISHPENRNAAAAFINALLSINKY